MDTSVSFAFELIMSNDGVTERSEHGKANTNSVPIVSSVFPEKYNNNQRA
jgi:hypothetical protein